MGLRIAPVRELAALCLLACSVSSWAIEPYVEYRKRVESSQTITALTDNLMGDSVSLYNGSTEFSVTDIDIPGNNTLPVQLNRRFKIDLTPSGTSPSPNVNLRGAGSWDVDVPYIAMSTLATAGWSDTRCSVGSTPSAEGFVSTDFWQGNSVHIPGGGDRVMLGLEAQTPRPSDGVTRKWTTRERDAFSCIAMKSGLTGEGFLMQTSSGLKYYFDVAVSRHQGIMTRTIVDHAFPITRTRYYLLASKVEDRFGNTVSYSYNAAGNPTSITSNEGVARQITLTYAGGRLATASAHGRTWQYQYGSGVDADWLTTVVRPDNSTWRYAYTGTLSPSAEPWDGGSNSTCTLQPAEIPAIYTLSVTHPAGAVGSFQFANQRHYRSGIHMSECLERVSADNYYWILHTPNFFDVMSLQSRTFTGPGLKPTTWGYSYGGIYQPLWGAGGPAVYPCTTCISEKNVTVTQPDGATRRYRYGILYAANEGRLLGSEVLDAAGLVKRTESTTYLPDSVAATQAFHPRYGLIYNGDDPSTAYVRPVVAQTIIQDGVTFSMQVPTGCYGTAYCFDIYGNPIRAVRSSTVQGSPSRTEDTAYFHQTDSWVLGQVATVTCAAPTTCAGKVMKETTYDGTTALPLLSKAFGKLKQTLTYNADGTVATVSDGRDGILGAETTITLSSWKRGMPQQIKHPATPESPTGALQLAVVSDDGTLASVTDENGYTTTYAYDAMLRVREIGYPTGDSVIWTKTTLAFVPISVPEYGIEAGHWKHTITTGNSRKVSYFDAFWRPLIEAVVDDANPSETSSFTVKRYDVGGHVEFQSYPVGALTNYASTALLGTHSTYDALDRVKEVAQDWEGSAVRLKTESTYLPGFKVQVTNPRGHATVTRYLAYDQPRTDWPLEITHPESAVTTIDRDDFGKPEALTRSGPGVAPLTRSYAYDIYQQLCRTWEPETGVTLMGYDYSGNLAWSAAGLPSEKSCGWGDATVSARRVTRAYDARNRLTTLTFPDGNGSQTWTYWPDGLVKDITTQNELGTVAVINAYTYNRRRLLTGEAITQPGYTMSLGYGYNAQGHQAVSLTQPSGEIVNFAPNALGQATQATSSLASYATGAKYFPNGALKQFTYGNQIVHTMTQNTRGLPEVSRDAYGTTEFLDDSYDYDQNGNVAAISDGASVNQRGNRVMTYDALDRLKTAQSPMFVGSPANGTASYTYDVLDNLTRVVAPGRDWTYYFDGSRQLTNIVDTGTGSTVMGLDYNEQGNLKDKNGQLFDFDYGNRLRQATGKESYRYDGHGRRVLARSGQGLGDIRSVYGNDGVLRYVQDDRQDKVFNHIYLAGSLVATRETPYGTSNHVIKYQHTDALGSPVRVTDANRVELLQERTEYEPYGKVLSPASPKNGPGYTGHVYDAATGLNYMQQRYYDPELGRFLSVDPIAVNPRNGSGFNRYAYAFNNPYRFSDPDGRCEAPTGTRICAPIRRFSTSDITVVQSYDPQAQAPVELPSGSNAATELKPVQQQAARALNRAARELQSRGLKEHIDVLNKADVYLSVETVGEGKAFVSQAPVFDIVINSQPFSRLWDGFKVGLMLHEVHHFTSRNRQLYNFQRDNRLPMGAGAPYENDAFQFQRDLGFPASGTFDFDGLEEDAQ